MKHRTDLILSIALLIAAALSCHFFIDCGASYDDPDPSVQDHATSCAQAQYSLGDSLLVQRPDCADDVRRP